MDYIIINKSSFLYIPVYIIPYTNLVIHKNVHVHNKYGMILQLSILVLHV